MPTLPSKDQRVDIRAPHGDVARWRAIATAENMTFSDWIRRACRVSAEAFEAVEKALREAEAKGRRKGSGR